MKIDIHVHTVFSIDGFMSVENAILRAKQAGLDCLAFTDHNSVACHPLAKSLSKKYDFPVILGSEVKTDSGEILALNINGPIKPGMSVPETIDAIHKMGGVAVAAHPYSFLLYHKGLGRKIASCKIDAVEALNSRTFFGNGITQRIAKERAIPMAAGSDAHTISEIGNAYTEVNADNIEDALKKIRKGETNLFCRNTSLGSVAGWYWKKFARIFH